MNLKFKFNVIQIKIILLILITDKPILEYFLLEQIFWQKKDYYEINEVLTT